jgi:NAD(P)-dependent dehydrogenase (short-subunit alcohol dehydrogenase family)
LAAEGASVVANYSSSKEGADEVVADIIAAGGKAIAVGTSVAKEEDIVSLFEGTKKAYGHVDNAGIYGFAPPPRHLKACPEDGPFYLSENSVWEALPQMMGD